MELDRKDSIDFAADVTLYVAKIGIAKVIDNFIERKSIKAEATVETPSVNDNEAQKKDCNSCEHRWMPITDCCRCNSLNGYMYWQQSD